LILRLFKSCRSWFNFVTFLNLIQIQIFFLTDKLSFSCFFSFTLNFILNFIIINNSFRKQLSRPVDYLRLIFIFFLFELLIFFTLFNFCWSAWELLLIFIPILFFIIIFSNLCRSARELFIIHIILFLSMMDSVSILVFFWVLRDNFDIMGLW